MVVDIDRCTGCGACVIACAAENNVAPAVERATYRTGVTLLRIVSLSAPDAARAACMPMMCMQCEDETPCVSVCPQQAVEVDKLSGIVEQMPQRCLGCRYCMTACPYHARVFNWADPAWPKGMEAALNPDVAPRMRGVVEKCDFCQSRMNAAQDKAAMQGSSDPGAYTPACVEACATRAITFGDWGEPQGTLASAKAAGGTFAWLEQLGTAPKVRYRTQQPWIHALAKRGGAAPQEEVQRG
jgi:molybdopterin-containing oxidoreductase family iron-sulfur binding subunit